MESNEIKDLVLYFRDQIEEIGFVVDGATTSTNRWNFGNITPFSFEIYNIDITKLDFMVNAYTNYWSLDMDRENINDFLEYINNIDVVKCRLRKKKIKRINGRLGIKI
jgi:hypothetical protein